MREPQCRLSTDSQDYCFLFSINETCGLYHKRVTNTDSRGLTINSAVTTAPEFGVSEDPFATHLSPHAFHSTSAMAGKKMKAKEKVEGYDSLILDYGVGFSFHRVKRSQTFPFWSFWWISWRCDWVRHTHASWWHIVCGTPNGNAKRAVDSEVIRLSEFPLAEGILP